MGKRQSKLINEKKDPAKIHIPEWWSFTIAVIFRKINKKFLYSGHLVTRFIRSLLFDALSFNNSHLI